MTNPSSVFLNSYFWLIRLFDSDTDSDSDSEPTGTVLLKVTVLLAERVERIPPLGRYAPSVGMTISYQVVEMRGILGFYLTDFRMSLYFLWCGRPARTAWVT